MKKSKILFKISLFLLPLLVINASHAQTGNTSGIMDVSTTVIPVCNLNTSPAVTQYDPALKTTGARPITFKFTCTKDLSLTFKLDGGQNFDGVYRNLKSTNGRDFIKYNLTKSGNIVPGASFFTITSNGMEQISNFSITMLAKQNVAAGAFSDTVILSVEY